MSDSSNQSNIVRSSPPTQLRRSHPICCLSSSNKFLKLSSNRFLKNRRRCCSQPCILCLCSRFGHLAASSPASQLLLLLQPLVDLLRYVLVFFVTSGHASETLQKMLNSQFLSEHHQSSTLKGYEPGQELSVFTPKHYT